MRIGTWNLEGKWSDDHARVLTGLDCDVWLLTENRPDVLLDGYTGHMSSALMSEAKHWAGVITRGAHVARPDPHAATVGVEFAQVPIWCSVLPWPLARDSGPWNGPDHPSRYASALRQITAAIAGRPGIWGGDWNQPLRGNIAGFSRKAQDALLSALDQLELQVPTNGLPARNGAQFSIDHISVPLHWDVLDEGSERVHARLSDHDVYWVEVETPAG